MLEAPTMDVDYWGGVGEGGGGRGGGGGEYSPPPPTPALHNSIYVFPIFSPIHWFHYLR
jgi:hypothetical protein